MDRCVELTLDRSFRQTQRVGNFSQLESLMMAHDEHDSLPVRQP
jgi:hypothetical protein